MVSSSAQTFRHQNQNYGTIYLLVSGPPAAVTDSIFHIHSTYALDVEQHFILSLVDCLAHHLLLGICGVQVHHHAQAHPLATMTMCELFHVRKDSFIR